MLKSEGKYSLAAQSNRRNWRNSLSKHDAYKTCGHSAKSEIQISAIALRQISMDMNDASFYSNVPFPQEQTVVTTEIKLYKKRFWILALYSLCSTLNSMQWVQYTVTADVTMCFYGVDLNAVTWTANIFGVMFAPLAVPVSWFINRTGIRNAMLVASSLSCISTAIQCACTTPGTFTFVLFSQGLAAVAQVFILALPSNVSATWFGENELSRASAVGVFGNHLGCALGFIFSPLVVSSDCSNISLIGKGKEIVAYTLVSSNVLLLLLILTTFNKRPEKPPSVAQEKKSELGSDYKRSVCALLKNINFDILLISYGLIIGVSVAISIILFSLISEHFPNKEKEIGWIGFLSTLAGAVGSISVGYILDWTHRYKELSLMIFVLTFASTILFAGMLYVNALWIQFITFGLLGFLVNSYPPVALEFAVEITYPEPETVSATMLFASSTILGLIFTNVGSRLSQSINGAAANAFFCAVLLLGIIVITFMKCDYRRQKQRNDPNPLRFDRPIV